MLKQILIPVAAFAVTVTGVSAFNSDMLSKIDVDLSDAQVSALEQAEEIKTTAFAEAKTVLENAGIDESKMKEIHKAMHAERKEMHEAVETALENNDYEAFKTAVADMPFAEEIDSAEKFARLAEAHKLKESGDKEGARAIFEELGIERGPMGKGGFGGGHGFGMRAQE